MSSVKSSLILATAPVLKTQTLLKSNPDLDDTLGDLLEAVQKERVYQDGKTFVDLVPSRRVASIRAEYNLLKESPGFNLREFVNDCFVDSTKGVYPQTYVPNPNHTPLEQIDELWTFFERRNRLTRGSLELLPYTYIVPGGRFGEQFYWDTYFIMLGLASSQRWNLIEGMMKNFAFQIRKHGYIPTANRTYLLSRSQPPFFSHMVRLLATQKGEKKVLREYLPLLTAEYRFWMRGHTKLKGAEQQAFRRVVKMPNGALLNRYYDNKTTPRPESLREDVEVAAQSKRKDTPHLYLHLRAAAESGWDFSSRWLRDPFDLKTIHTTDIIPVDLNCLLYHLEETIADAYAASFNPFLERQFRAKARLRKQAINDYCWDDEAGFYKDFDFHESLFSPVCSVAAVFPLYVGVASKQQAARVAETLRKDFLEPGGLVTTQINNDQQWDAPNGWAPLQWVAIQGLRRYGFNDLADEIARRWLTLNENVFRKAHKFVEKYDVRSDGNSNGGGIGGGGEYAPQDGFGWTNGVYEALKRGYRLKL